MRDTYEAATNLTPAVASSEEALIAVALDEADTTLQQAVHRHIVARARSALDLLGRYRSLQQVFTALQDTRSLEEPLQQAQERLTQLLCAAGGAISAYHWFPTALGPYAIATSAQGVSLAHLGGTGDAVVLAPLGGRRVWRCMKMRPPCRPTRRVASVSGGYL